MAAPQGVHTLHQDMAVRNQGMRSRSTPVTATSDGLTTGLIPHGASYITITSDGANNIATLPPVVADDVGMCIIFYIGGTGCEIRCPASSTSTINGVQADSQEAAIPATTLNRCYLVAVASGVAQWIMESIDEGGDDITAIVPD